MTDKTQVEDLQRLLRQCVAVTMDSEKPDSVAVPPVFNTPFEDIPDLINDRWCEMECEIAQQQVALQLAEQALKDLVEISVCSCSRGDEFRTDHHEQCDWIKVQAALTAISEAKEFKSHPQPDLSQDQE